MTEYKLIQMSEGRSSKIQYQLLCNDQVQKASCTYMEGVKYVWSKMQPGDTFQEQFLGQPLSAKTTYEEMMKQQALDIAFAQGKQS